MPRRGTWPEHPGLPPGVDVSTLTRQQKRRIRFEIKLNDLRERLGGFSYRGGFYYPEGMTRRIMRKIARDFRGDF